MKTAEEKEEYTDAICGWQLWCHGKLPERHKIEQESGSADHNVRKLINQSASMNFSATLQYL